MKDMRTHISYLLRFYLQRRQKRGGGGHAVDIHIIHCLHLDLPLSHPQHVRVLRIYVLYAARYVFPKRRTKEHVIFGAWQGPH